jgi:hypothetical protein
MGLHLAMKCNSNPFRLIFVLVIPSLCIWVYFQYHLNINFLKNVHCLPLLPLYVHIRTVYIMIHLPHSYMVYALVTLKSVISQHHYYQNIFIICAIMHDILSSSQFFELRLCFNSRGNCFLFLFF